jgi:ectoine hydroxylase-related dioxygenase (phytanoyl-CoA dioxygenase family)
VITRKALYLRIRTDPAPDASAQLEAEGHAVLRGVLDGAAVAALRADIDRVFAELPPDERQPTEDASRWEPFRYEMLNRSAVCQEAIAHPAILEAIEPLLGEDCHVIANTAWRQPPEENSHGGRFWHIDAGPHVPRPADVPWDDRIPYPIFAIAAHLYLQDCPPESGPTGVIPGSHKSGQAPPLDKAGDPELTWRGRSAVSLLAEAGDVALFVSDVWHRRLPSGPGDPGRYFLQCHYGRRDLAQRLRPTSQANQLSPEAVARAQAPRERTLIGLHQPFFYDG